jgi:hypothetical protein
MRRDDEQIVAACCHWCNAIPIWGLMFCGVMYFYFRETSRYLVAQTRQAMFFHGVMLAAALAWIISELIARVTTELFELVGETLQTINKVVIVAIYLAYLAVCAWGGARSWLGKPFVYPLVGNQEE